ncbi:MAG: transporter [Nitrospirota bacterium]
MKKYLFSAILSFLFLCGDLYGFEISGLQPVDPYGIFSTFSTESYSKGRGGVSTGIERIVDPDYSRLFLKGAYGITNNIEINITVPYVIEDDYHDGFEDIALGVKHRFFNEGKYGPSFAYILNASIPSGMDKFSRDGNIGIGFLVSKRVGPVNGHVNFFYEKPGDRDFDDEILFLTGLDFAAAHNFDFIGELYCKKDANSDEFKSVEGRFGYRIRTIEFLYTTLGVGFGLKDRTPASRIMFSVTFLLPYEKKEIKKIYEEE